MQIICYLQVLNICMHLVENNLFKLTPFWKLWVLQAPKTYIKIKPSFYLLLQKVSFLSLFTVFLCLTKKKQTKKIWKSIHKTW